MKIMESSKRFWRRSKINLAQNKINSDIDILNETKISYNLIGGMQMQSCKKNVSYPKKYYGNGTHISTHKVNLYMVHFDWYEFQWTYKEKPTPHSISVPNDQGTNISIDF